MFVVKLEQVIFYLLLLFLSTQLGKHFWPEFSIISGLRVDYLSPTLYVTDILTGLLFFTWITRKVQDKTFKVQSFIPLFVLVTFLLLTICLSQNYLNGAYHLVRFLEFFFVAYYVATTIVRMEQVKKVFLFLGIGVIFQSLLAVSQFIKQGSLGGIFYFFGERLFSPSTPGIANASINGELLLRPYGTFPHPNVLAGFLLLSMIGLVFTVPWAKGKEKAVWIVALLLGSSALLLTMSRGAFLIWLLLLLIIFLRHVSTQLIRTFLAIALVILAVLFIFHTPFGTRFLQTNFAEEAVVQRTELIRASAVMITEHPIVGVGFGNFLPALAIVQKPFSLGLYLQPVHNIFLLILAETGIIGFGIFMWFLVKTYMRLLITKKTGALSSRIFAVLLSVILMLGLVDHYFFTIQQGQLLFALIAGLSWTKMKTP